MRIKRAYSLSVIIMIPYFLMFVYLEKIGMEMFGSDREEDYLCTAFERGGAE